MKRITWMFAVALVIGAAAPALADCACGTPAAVYYPSATTVYSASSWQPSTSASVVTGSPMPTAVTTYYPTATTAYYAAPVTTYYAPTPVTTYYAPSTVYYSPAPVVTYYNPGYVYGRYWVPGQPIRNFFRR